jgi:threonine dehydrogenase-like Zn-dependent dehydrogenase
MTKAASKGVLGRPHKGVAKIASFRREVFHQEEENMKAVVFRGVGDIRLEDVPEPKIKEPMDAIVRITTSAICGTDLHMVRGTMAMMEPGTILGHEGVGIVEKVGKGVRNLKEGDRVVIPSTIACGYCSYCREGYFAQCDNANPNGRHAGTAFFGGPKMSGPFNGLQAEKARIPYANVGLVKLPDYVTDDQAILISDIFPTGYFGADLAEIEDGDTVAVFGCGPVGQFTILSARLMGAARVIAVDQVPDRLEMARDQGAEVIDFSSEDPVSTILDLTGEIGVDRVIDAVGVDAERPHGGPAAKKSRKKKGQFKEELEEIVPERPEGDIFQPGDAPSQALSWAVESLAKAGTLAIIGVYPPTVRSFPIGQAMMKNLTIQMGNCNHRKYIPRLVDLVSDGVVDPDRILTKVERLTSAIEAYKAFDNRDPGWIKVELGLIH